ncbi:MAG TPA: dihydroorotate dehydrogenase electron transfer subunit [Bacteroidota bacterium]|nr:dihydroorotate dehydrogenase electron transfer subunit [Bacteroidota bacterium]
MHQEPAIVRSLTSVTPEIKRLTLHAPAIAACTEPGQFLNIRVDTSFPLLRRPFSVYDVQHDTVSIIFNVIGKGTSALAHKEPGDVLDIIGPCGNSFMPFAEGEYDTAVLLAGGIGVAPFPFLTKRLAGSRRIETFLGARGKDFIIHEGIENLHIATDDGSEGFHGTVLDLFKEYLGSHDIGRARLFICGPSRMMRAVADFALEMGIDAYASVECEMACGIGLCQGCAIESKGGPKKYYLVCKDGTIFDTRTVKI